ncbi:hypothetical protein EST38_g5938 [Candolleomyces aberdarensis]|uniref:Uncharacterized protein n=1 Tax=Candolleomyces aberdarensis TaxID=2316362 RepID=A0A4Q2DJC5_9AGAR|nr:hypothetical protein EST38_g5938 [Candolleomyces aberdarensis]
MFFNGMAPSLRTLKLHNCIIIPTATSFPNLADPTITSSTEEVDIAYLLAWWNMCCSGELSSLETLVIKGVTFSSSFPVNRCSAAQGSMPQSLRMIHLTGDLDACVWMLDRDAFGLPPSCSLRLYVAGPTWPPLILEREELPDSVFYPERVLDGLLSEMWRVDASPCLEFILDAENFRFKHVSTVRTIYIRGETGDPAEGAFRRTMQKVISGDIVTKLNLTPSTGIKALRR